MRKPILPQFKLFSKAELLVISTFILIALSFFGLGYIVGLKSSGKFNVSSTVQVSQLNTAIEELEKQLATSSILELVAGEERGKSFEKGAFVASRNGSRYYPADCPAASRIKKQNQIWFNSASEAELAGYSANNICK